MTYRNKCNDLPCAFVFFLVSFTSDPHKKPYSVRTK